MAEIVYVIGIGSVPGVTSGFQDEIDATGASARWQVDHHF
jgi:hypothetical protein